MVGLGFENVKQFKTAQQLDFAKITLLTGTNNSGKSTVISIMQLIKENYKGLENIFNDDSNLGLDEIMNVKFGIGDLAEKFGNLEMFLNNETQRKEFDISFKTSMPYCEDVLKITFTIELTDSSLRNGIIKKLVISSIDCSEQIIEIKRREEPLSFEFSLVLNYKYFTNLYYNWKEKLDATLTLDDLKLSSNNSIYDTSNLFKEEALQLELQALLFKFYKSSECNELFEKDLIDFLSKVKFVNTVVLRGINGIITSSSSRDISVLGLKTFLELYSNIKEFRKFAGEKEDILQPNKSYCELRFFSKENFEDSINNNPPFFNDLLIPFISLVLNNYGKKNPMLKGNSSREDVNSFQLDYYPTSAEKVIDNLITSTLFEVKKNLKLFTLIDQVSTFRIPRKRVHSLSDKSEFVRQIKSLESLSNVPKKESFSFINKWLQIFEIADSFIIKTEIDTDNFKSYLAKNGKEVLIADYGFGTIQILPLLLSLIPLINQIRIVSQEKEMGEEPVIDENTQFEFTYKNKTIIIEEPEANLHPALQSKLADLFVDAANTFGVQIIVETHSEYLIRKLQYLVAKGTANTDDALIYYFYKPDHPDVVAGKVEQVVKMEIDGFGRLSKEFGSGFFDEADNIAMELFLLNQSQSN